MESKSESKPKKTDLKLRQIWVRTETFRKVKLLAAQNDVRIHDLASNLIESGLKSAKTK